MAVNLNPPGALLPIAGLKIGVAAADIRQQGAASRDDIVLFGLPTNARSAVVQTNNAFAAAPVRIVRGLRAEAGQPVAMLVNSGNANAGTGEPGLQDAIASCEAVAEALDLVQDDAWRHVWPFSTGVIGQRMPIDAMKRGIRDAAAAMEDANGTTWLRAAKTIMTTDTVPKAVSRELKLSCGTLVRITGIAKGAGMIRPDMATMLSFIATDAAISPDALDRMLTKACDASFHCISIDGDTSTNDAAVLIATGAAGNQAIELGGEDAGVFSTALEALALELAQAVIRDGEGASKFVTIAVSGARTTDEARAVGFAIAQSPLVKTAWFASDANWGRMLAAVGRSGIEGLQMRGVSLSVSAGERHAAMIAAGEPVAAYTEQQGAAIFAQDEFTVHVALGRGDHSVSIWTCDLGHEYVRINAEYRT